MESNGYKISHYSILKYIIMEIEFLGMHLNESYMVAENF